MIWGFWEPGMERDQKLVIHCASKGDFHSPRAVGGLFWGFSLPRETGTIVLTLRSQRFDGGQWDHEGAHGFRRHISTLDRGHPCLFPPPSSPQSRSGTEVALNRAEKT